jgi:hypothetical protein
VRSLTFARPVIDLRALAIRNFSLGWWVSFVTGIGIFTTVYLTPLFLGRVRGFNAQIGMAMLSAGAIQLAAVRVYSVLANRVDLRSLMMFGLACFPMGLWSFTPITHDWGWSELLLPQAFRGSGSIMPSPELISKAGSALIRFRHFIGGLLALASLNRACRDLAPAFPQRSPPWYLATAACGGLRSAHDCQPRRALLHHSHSWAPPLLRRRFRVTRP